MQHDFKQARIPESEGSELARAMNQVTAILVEALHHGFFEGSISIETRRAGKVDLLFKAGKSYKFTIPIEELPR